MMGVVMNAGAGAIIMHMKGTPQDMQENPSYDKCRQRSPRIFSRRL